MLVLPNAMAVQEEGCKEKLALWEMGLDSWWEIHLVVDQGKVGVEKDSWFSGMVSSPEMVWLWPPPPEPEEPPPDDVTAGSYRGL